MPCWIRSWIATLLLMMLALPLRAQDLRPWEGIYCPTAAEERARQCRRAEATLQRNQKLLASVGSRMHDPDILLVRVERAPGESLAGYRARVKQQQGVATEASNRWLPLQGRYYDPERQVFYVALERQAYWQYVWEKLAPDEELARRTFLSRERESRRYKQMRFTGPDGQLAQWEQEIENARRFQEFCCRPLTETAVEPPLAPLPGQPRP